MENIIYRIPFVIFILNIIDVILTYFWNDSYYFASIIFIITGISWAGFVTNKNDIHFYDDIFVNGSKLINLIFVICILYTFINFFVNLAILSEGPPQVIHGLYYQIDKLHGSGKFIEISEVKYYKLILAESRLMSGTVLIFSVIPLPTWYRRLKILNEN